MLLLSTFVAAQTTILDFEGAAPETIDFNGSATTVIANPDQSGENTSAMVAQNVVPAGAAFAGSIRPISVDFANGTLFTLQVWSPIANAPVLLKLEEGGGGAFTERQAVASGAAMSWQTVEFDFGGEAIRSYPNITLFMNFNVIGGEELTFFYDNLIQTVGGGGGGGGVAGPSSAAPTPTRDASDVVSLYSDAYDNVTVATFAAGFSNATLIDTSFDNNPTLYYQNLGFAGIETGPEDGLDLVEAEMTHLHMSFYSPNSTIFKVKLVDFGGDGFGGDNADLEFEVPAFPAQNEWVSVEIPLVAFFGVPLTDVAQIIIVSEPFPSSDVFIDNIYFYRDDSPVLSQVDLPVTFDEAGVDYSLFDFEGASSMLVDDPTMTGNTVVSTTKNAGAATFAGTTITAAGPPQTGFASPIPVSEGNTTMTVRVWSPTAGTNVRLKIEDAGDATVSVETEATTTIAMNWEVLTFDFANQAAGTAPINFASNYNKATIFFDFGNSPTEAATYFWDDVQFDEGNGGGGDALLDLPITFDNSDVSYGFIDFGGAMSNRIEDPTMAGNQVGEFTKTAGALLFAGTVLITQDGPNEALASRINFTEDANVISMRVWSPTAGTPVRIKVENAADGGQSVEAQVNTTVAMEWETLFFDFREEIEGAPIDYNRVYDKIVVFFDFGSTPMTIEEEATYYYDDIIFTGDNEGGDGGGGGTDENLVALPVDFNNPMTNHDLGDFAGASSTLVADPTDASNTVVETVKNIGAQTFAGTTMGATNGMREAIGFNENQNTVSVRVWSPTAGTPVRVKVENADDGSISVETEVLTTVAMEWETLEFDFRENATENTLNYDAVYDKLTIFFDFGNAAAVASTYYWDDVILLDATSVTAPITGVLGAYPNPVADRLTLTAPRQMDQITVYSMTGAKVGTWAAGSDRMDLDVAHFVPGTYVAIVVAGDEVYSVKFMRR
ncbi:hypothetical protein A3850_008355 [Lewinella sp. 4G2]|nr:hypothetical protein A3850_008355 [Lewinella sp. 4G2]